MCRKCWKKGQQEYTCTICGRIRNQGDMPKQYLCTDCLGQLYRVGLHGQRDYRLPGHKSKWTPLSDEDKARLVVRKCECPRTCIRAHSGECNLCGGSGVILDRKSDLDMIAEAIG